VQHLLGNYIICFSFLIICNLSFIPLLLTFLQPVVNRYFCRNLAQLLGVVRFRNIAYMQYFVHTFEILVLQDNYLFTFHPIKL